MLGAERREQQANQAQPCRGNGRWSNQRCKKEAIHLYRLYTLFQVALTEHQWLAFHFRSRLHSKEAKDRRRHVEQARILR